MKTLDVTVLIDALPWELVRAAGWPGDRFPTRGPLSTVLGYSTAALPTVFTGLWPAQHGHWAMYAYSPGTSPFRFLRPLGLLGPLAERASVRRWADRRVRRRGEVQGYFSLYSVPLRRLPLFDICERRDIFSPRAFPGAPSLFDLLEGTRHRVWTWRAPEEANRLELLRTVREGDSRHLFFYSPVLDGVMHRTGVGSEETRVELEGYGNFLGEIMDEAGRSYDRVEIEVLSDHGMRDVESVHDLMNPLFELPPHEGRDYVAFFDSTLARFWFLNAAARSAVEEYLGALSYGRVLRARELDDLGLGFSDERYGEVIFLVHPGRLIVPSYMGAEGPRAMHGYHPDDAHSSGVYISTRETARPPRHIRGLHPMWRDRLRAGEGAS
jgi:hypothetical protein